MTYINPLGAVLSSGNSSTSTLSNGATFTGTGELTEHPDVLITVDTDQSGVLYCEFSHDNSNWDSSLSFAVAADIYEIHRLVKGYRYFRARFTNDSGSDQTHFRMNVSYGIFGPLTSPMTLTVGTDADTLMTRTRDFALDQAMGRYSGETVVGKFGQNAVVGTSYEDVWAAGGSYTGFLTSAATLRIKSGGSSDDDSSGSGAQQVILEGLDSSFAAITETLTTNGASASSASSNSFIRLNRAYIGNVGTYHGANAGNIVIETSGGTTVGQITLGIGQTQLAIYCVPAGKVGYIDRLWGNVDGSKPASFRFWQCQNADDTTTPFTGKRILRNYPSVSGSFNNKLTSLIEVPAETDIWVSAAADSSTVGVAAGFDLYLVDV